METMVAPPAKEIIIDRLEAVVATYRAKGYKVLVEKAEALLQDYLETSQLIGC